MLFNSIHFLIFFPVVVFIYFSLPHRFRWMLLLTASYYFYMSWKAEYAILILLSTIIDYSVGRGLNVTESVSKRKLLLITSLFSNLGLLFAFKYLTFFGESTRALLAMFSIPFEPWTLNVLLPVGISFYTFQTLSYTIDLYRKKIPCEKHFGIFAVYVSFFPQLVAGPIERAKNLLPQFFEKHNFDYKRVTDGLKLMLWGFFKKVVIADRLAIVVNTIYNNPTDYTGIPLILATFFFAFQIYCDFSGYSDIAIGAAQVMGYRLMDNFRRPYYARSISEFWKRWHISLSTWFKDYLYIPLGGNRVTIPRWYFNLFIVFLVSGLWHGANWTFVIWGGLHGFYLVFSIVTKKVRKWFSDLIGLTKFPKVQYVVQIIITFLLVNVGWVFFRANSLSDALYVLSNLFTGLTLNLNNVDLGGVGGLTGLVIAFASILFMEFIHLIQEHRSVRHFLSDKSRLLRWAIYVIIILGILLFGVFERVEFIYFQF